MYIPLMSMVVLIYYLGGHSHVFLYTGFCTLVALCHREWEGTRQRAHSDTSAHQNLPTGGVVTRWM